MINRNINFTPIDEDEIEDIILDESGEFESEDEIEALITGY